MATEAAAEVTVKRTAHGQGQESVQEGQQSQEDKGVSTAGGWFSWVKSQVRSSASFVVRARLKRHIQQSEALAQDLAAGVTAESDRLSRNLKGLLDLATQDDESDDEGEERDLTSLQSTTQDAQPNRQPEAEEEADDDVSSGFEEGTLLYKLDTLAEQAESYIGNLSLGLSEQVTTFLKKAVVIVPPIEGQEPRRELRQVPVDRTAALVAVMRASQATYMTDYGSDSVTQQVQDRYKAFESTFEVEKVKDQVVAALREASELVDLHASLGKKRFPILIVPHSSYVYETVPAQLSYNTFWTRYFFRLSEIQLEEETRKQVLQSASLLFFSRCVVY